MDNVAHAVKTFLVDNGIIIVNGVIYLAILFQRSLPQVLALLSALGILAFDRAHRLKAWTRPAPDISPGIPRVAPHIQDSPLQEYGQEIFTVAALVLWLMAAHIWPEPIPWLGAAMWLITVVTMTLLPIGRLEVGFRGKSMLIAYALALLGLRWFAALAGGYSPTEWAAILGGKDNAARIIANNLGIALTIGTWVTWFGLPLAHFSYMVQRLLINRPSLIAPWRSMEEIVHALRTREE